MSSKPLLFFRDHRSWQLKTHAERKLALQRRSGDFYTTFQTTLPS